MKNYSFTSILFILPLFLCAQSDSIISAKKNIVKFKILSVGIDELKFQYERVLNNRYSVALDIGYINDKIGTAQIFSKQNPRSGFDIRPELRYYFAGSAPKGYYVGLFGLLIKDEEKFGSDTIKVTNNTIYLGGGLVAGKQWIIKRISIDAVIGCGLYNSYLTQHVDINNGISEVHSEYKGNKYFFLPVLNLSIGYVF